MRTLSADFAAHLDDGATTLCRCWTLTRRDGAVMGFTDHDRDIALNGTVHAAATGLEAAEATSELGFAVGGGEVAGALVAAAITEADIAAGLYDDATVETWLVDWSSPQTRLLLDVATIGEISRTEYAFVAELRGLMHRLDETRGRLFQPGCAADLGDARCRVNLDTAMFHAVATVAATDGRLGLSALLAAFADGWFTGGRLVWTSGGNAGVPGHVKLHRASGGMADLVLWQPAPRPIRPGDAFRVDAGCDKRFSTCRAKFANTFNFRGFPHMPGNDFVIRYPTGSEPGLDGGSLFR